MNTTVIPENMGRELRFSSQHRPEGVLLDCKHVIELMAAIRQRPGSNAISLKNSYRRNDIGHLLQQLEYFEQVVYKSTGWYLTSQGDITLVTFAE